MHERALAKCESHVADAIAKGGRVLAGGRRHALGGTFFEPTVIADADDAMLIAREETFGPVAAVFRFEDEAEVIARANDTIYGLAAYVWSNDLNRVARVTARARVRHGRGQLRQDDRRADPVRRRQAVRSRPRGLTPRARGVHRAEIRLHRDRRSRLTRRMPP